MHGEPLPVAMLHLIEGIRRFLAAGPTGMPIALDAARVLVRMIEDQQIADRPLRA